MHENCEGEAKAYGMSTKVQIISEAFPEERVGKTANGIAIWARLLKTSGASVIPLYASDGGHIAM